MVTMICQLHAPSGLSGIRHWVWAQAQALFMQIGKWSHGNRNVPTAWGSGLDGARSWLKHEWEEH